MKIYAFSDHHNDGCVPNPRIEEEILDLETAWSQVDTALALSGSLVTDQLPTSEVAGVYVYYDSNYHGSTNTSGHIIAASYEDARDLLDHYYKDMISEMEEEEFNWGFDNTNPQHRDDAQPLNSKGRFCLEYDRFKWRFKIVNEIDVLEENSDQYYHCIKTECGNYFVAYPTPHDECVFVWQPDDAESLYHRALMRMVYRWL